MFLICKLMFYHLWYRLQTGLCYEDRMECELNGWVDMSRYFVLILSLYHFL